MSKKIKSRSVGVFIENKEPPTVLLYIDHIIMRVPCSNERHAERVYAEIADVFDLWQGDKPKWIPPR